MYPSPSVVFREYSTSAKQVRRFSSIKEPDSSCRVVRSHSCSSSAGRCRTRKSRAVSVWVRKVLNSPSWGTTSRPFLFYLTLRVSVGLSVLIWQYYTGAEVLVPSVSQGTGPGWFGPLYSGNPGLTATSRRRMMVCREVPNSRATALILAPTFRCSSAACCCSGFSASGRPNCLPAALALAKSEYVRSISRSFSNSATAQCETVYANIGRCQLLHGLPNVHCVTAQAIKLGHYQHIAIFHTFK